MNKTLTRVQLNILPVGSGDCLHLRFQSSGRWHNVIIDSGPGSTSGVFRKLLKQIETHKEVVDLLCFSHIDDDHIKGAEDVFASPSFDPNLIRQVWLNVPNGEIPAKSEAGTFSPKSVETAIKLLKFIVKYEIPLVPTVTEGLELILGDARIKTVLPKQKRLDAFYEKWNKDAERFRTKSVRKDTSITNGSSIALLCTIGSRRLLMVGDAFADDLADVGDQYAGEQGFSVVKIPHHGSDENVTAKMIQSLNTREFIISTEQNKYRPGCNAMSVLSSYGAGPEGVTVYGNYVWPRFAAGVPNVKIICPKNKFNLTKDGIEVYSDGNSSQLYAEQACGSDSQEQ